MHLAILVLSVAGALTGSNYAIDRLSQPSAAAQVAVSPQAKSLRALANLVEESRSLESMLIMLERARDRRDQETRMLSQRQLVARQLSALAADTALSGPYMLQVTTSHAAWVVAQQRTAAAIPLGSDGRGGLSKARQIFNSESAQAFEAFLQAIRAAHLRLGSP